MTERTHLTVTERAADIGAKIVAIAVAIFLVAPILVIFPLSFTSATLNGFSIARALDALVRRLLHQSSMVVGAPQ